MVPGITDATEYRVWYIYWWVTKSWV